MYDLPIDSDHYPIQLNLKLNKEQNDINTNTSSNDTQFDYGKANWNKFKKYLEQVDCNDILNSNDINVINNFVVEKLKVAASISIPLKKENKTTVRLPKNVIKLIKIRRKIKKHMRKNLARSIRVNTIASIS